MASVHAFGSLCVSCVNKARVPPFCVDQTGARLYYRGLRTRQVLLGHAFSYIQRYCNSVGTRVVLHQLLQYSVGTGVVLHHSAPLQ